MSARAAPPARLVAVADYGVLRDRLADAVTQAAKGGIRWFLLRAKGLEAAGGLELAKLVLAASPSIFLSLYGEGEAAKSAGCGGLHFASADLADIRKAFGLLAGASCHDGRELALARENGAAYCFLSPVYGTISKASLGLPLGEARFAELARGAGMPVFALGGVRPENMEALAGAGAYGAAVLGDLFLAPDVRARASQWVETIERVYGK